MKIHRKASYRRETEMLKVVFCIWCVEIIEEASYKRAAKWDYKIAGVEALIMRMKKLGRRQQLID